MNSGCFVFLWFLRDVMWVVYWLLFIVYLFNWFVLWGGVVVLFVVFSFL